MIVKQSNSLFGVLFVTTVFVSLSACVKFRDADTETAPPPRVPDSITRSLTSNPWADPSPYYELKPQASVGDYSLRFLPALKQISCVDERTKNVAVFHYTNNEIDVQSRDEYSCSGFDLNNEMKLFTIKVPNDIYLTDMHILKTDELSSYRSLGRLYLASPNAGIQTSGLDTVIEAEEIYSSGGTIITWPDALAPEGEPGHDAGSLLIRANVVNGLLKVDSHGQNGGAGLKGASQAAYPQPPARGMFQFPGMIYCDACWAFISNPENHMLGLPAHKGSRGNDGQDGKNGGATGPVILQVNHFTVKPEIRFRVGLGGPPGEGGDPKPPSLGGEHGDRVCHHVFNDPHPITCTQARVIPLVPGSMFPTVIPPYPIRAADGEVSTERGLPGKNKGQDGKHLEALLRTVVGSPKSIPLD